LGIKKTELNYLFKKFYRRSNVQNIQGTGLSLSILRDLILLLSIINKKKDKKWKTFGNKRNYLNQNEPIFINIDINS
jgi:signal transduction histidine kinase